MEDKVIMFGLKHWLKIFTLSVIAYMALGWDYYMELFYLLIIIYCLLGIIKVIKA